MAARTCALNELGLGVLGFGVWASVLRIMMWDLGLGFRFCV